ncbi:MAG TPA: sigma-70 family RNA polymerase sigma factor [Solirubrobacterales bacterium]|nr:sigma-70 family RNA polymerase sigma factor [Solirubrobacterales bacterium]
MASRRQPPRQERNDRNADLLDRLMREHGARFLHQARFHSERKQDAEDALGDACVQFLARFEGEEDDEARRWMLVVVKRCAWGIARRRRERRAVVAEDSAERLEIEAGVGLLAGDRGPAELAVAAEEVKDFERALASLKADECRAVILLALGHTYAEIGTRCGWTRTKVNRSLAEGRARLRRLLDERGENS